MDLFTIENIGGTPLGMVSGSTIKTKNRDLLNIEEELSENIGHKTQIDQQTPSKGKISISYSSKDEREAIISKLLKLKKN